MRKADLPREKAALLEPRQPLGEAAERYWARPDKVLNMVRLVDGFGLISALLAFMIALTTQREKLLSTGLLLGVTCFVMGGCLLRGLQHKLAGGDAGRRGFFLLAEGLLTWDGKTALWVPREDITGFDGEAGAGEYDASFLYPRLADGSRVPGVALPSVKMNLSLHRAYLEAWRETGAFSMEAYTHIARKDGD